MAAIDLQRGLEHSGRGWGQERPELMDSFDSEMQEWEDQLKDMQRKIEELYNEVQARRGGTDIAIDNRKNGGGMEFSLGHHGNGFFDEPDCDSNGSKHLPRAIAVPNHHGNSCNYVPNGCSYPVSHQNGYGCCRTNGVSEIGDLLQDYLDQGKQMSQKNNGTPRHVHFSDTIKVSQDLPTQQDETKQKSANNRIGQERFLGSFEEDENRKNQIPHMKGSPKPENTGGKPPVRQRDALRSASQLPDSPALERKFSPVVLVDRKNNSPSVLRKFGAMLQENEGKMLTDAGVVTHQGVVNRAPVRVPTQKCQTDSDVLTAEMEPSQEWCVAPDSGRHSHMDQRGGYCLSKGPQPSPQQSHRRAQVVGSPKLRPRANSGSDRDIKVGQGERMRKPAPQHVESRADHRALSGSSAAQRVQRVGLPGQPDLPGCGREMDDGLIELLDMLEIQHEYSSGVRGGHAPSRQEPHLVNPADSSTANPRRTFSRPARPANQRPPSRWASRTPTSSITTPPGPMYRPPSPLARPPSPMTRTSSPALKHQSRISYSLHTETVIM